MLRAVFLAIAAATALCGCEGLNSGGAAAAPAWPDVINVRNPVTLPAQIAAKRVPVGLAGDYKPDLVVLASGEMLLVMFQPVTNPNGTYQENMILYRSEDGGQTWGPRETLPLLGREPYFTLLSDGTLFITATFLLADYRNTEGYTYAIVYRSEDGGNTWTSLPILTEDVPNLPPGTRTTTRSSRNLIELADGALLLGVGAGANIDYLWRSQDEGLTWDKTGVQALTGYNEAANGVPWIGEFVFVLAPNQGVLRAMLSRGAYSRSCSSRQRILPAPDFGSESANSMSRGIL